MIESDSAHGSETSAEARRTFLRGAVGAGAALLPLVAMAAERLAPVAEFRLEAATEGVTPFRVAIAQAQLDDLKQRLAHVRWPNQETVPDWSQGVPLAKAKALVEYWRTRYDWRGGERALNAFPQFRTAIDGLGIHFIHVRSKHANALPLLLTHGWPGSVFEFLDVVNPLVDPTAHGGKAEDAFDVVIPSLPGFGFSDKPTQAGWGLPKIATAWGKLMQRLGYSKYVAQGGDWGAGVTTWMGQQKPAGLAGVHLNLPVLFPPPPEPAGGYSAEEKTALGQLIKFGTQLSGYAMIQGTRPETIGYGLADSPSGQAMWIYEKFQGWSDNKGDPAEAISTDRMLDGISLYWLTNTAASSARLYFESFYKDFHRIELDLPVTVSIFKGETFTPPKVWADRTYSKLSYWNEVPHGGHFAAMEQPALFVAEMRSALRQFR